MDKERVRAWWWKRQGLDDSLSGASCGQILARSGWARSVGGSNPYLTFWSRGGLLRAKVEETVKCLQIHELPCARGCAHVVPAQDYPLALQVAVPFGDAQMRAARKFDVRDAEIDQLCVRVLDSLRAGSREPEEIASEVGDAARSLGPEASKKKGFSSTLSLALEKLQIAGEIRKVPADGRLDGQRCQYVLWGFRVRPREDAFVELARRYFKAIGPADISEFQWFSGLGARAAKEAVAPLNLASYHGRYMFADDLDEMLSMKVPDGPAYKLVASLDSITVLRRDVRDLVAGEDGTRISAEKDLPANAILDRGRLVGLWEYDVETESIVWASFIRSCNELRAAVKAGEEYVRTDLGEVRTSSADGRKRRKKRIEALRACSLHM